MDYDELFVRSSLVGQPVAVLLRPSTLSSTFDPEVILAWQAALARLAPNVLHSITVLAENFSDPLPARVGNVRLRTAVATDPTSGRALTAFLQDRIEPIILWAEGDTVPAVDFIRKVLDRLEFADVVMARRRRTWGAILAWPIEKLVRGFLGIPFGDPLSPFKGLRRDAFAPIRFELSGDAVHLELSAKGTYLIRLVDEVPSKDRRSSWLSALVARGLGRFLTSPNLDLVEHPKIAPKVGPSQDFPLPRPRASRGPIAPAVTKFYPATSSRDWQGR
ncbi:hypothetical protein K2X85_00555 [bacterium]|nr:hypothetical protein [bacterium]